MEYREYTIKYEMDHVVVIAPDGFEWREDTVEDAKKEIDEDIEHRKDI